MVSVSVIMGVFKEPLEWLELSVKSVINQTLVDFELILVDDDPGNEALKHYLTELENNDARIKIIFNEENIGLTKSLNRAISQSRGDYIARMDADDEALPDRLLLQKKFLDEHQDVDVCGTYAKRFGDLPFYSNHNFVVGESNEEILIDSFFSNPIIHPSVMFRNNKNIFYNENCSKAQDYELWGRLLLAERKMQNIPLFLMKYRKTAKSSTPAYVSAQTETANHTRSTLINHFFLGITPEKLELHNKICSNSLNSQSNILSIENWLNEFMQHLIKKFPTKRKYIQYKISSYWEPSALLCSGYFKCISSSLSQSSKIKVFIRYCLNTVKKRR